MKRFQILHACADNLRKSIALYVFVPLLAASILVGLYMLAQAYGAYRALSERGVETPARIEQVTDIDGKTKRTAVNFSFVASDGQTYRSKALFSRDINHRLQEGQLMNVVYERNVPANNAPSLSYARHELRSLIAFVVIVTVLFWILGCIYRHDYKAIYASLRQRTAYA